MDIHLSRKAKEKLKEFGIGILYLIGSRATDTARENSDYDFAVVMQNPNAIFHEKSKLSDELSDLLSSEIPKPKTHLPYPENIINIDVVFLQTAPLYYAIAARDEGKVLFEISEEFRADFEEKVTLEYLDFEPFRREQERATLAMI